jgi:hypothetical protein
VSTRLTPPSVSVASPVHKSFNNYQLPYISMTTLEPPVQDLLVQMHAGMQGQTPSVDDVAAMRTAMSALIDRGQPVPGVTVTDVVINGVPVRLYRPQALGAPPAAPVVVWRCIHARVSDVG